MATIFIVLGVILVVYVVWHRSKTGSFRKGIKGTRRREHALYQELLRKALGDHDVVERLIALESKKSPHARREVWMQHAIDAWKRHNH